MIEATLYWALCGVFLVIVTGIVTVMLTWIVIRVWGESGLKANWLKSEMEVRQHQTDIMSQLADTQGSQNQSLIDISKSHIQILAEIRNNQLEKLEVVQLTQALKDEARSRDSVAEGMKDLARAGIILLNGHEIDPVVHAEIIGMLGNIIDRINTRGQSNGLDGAGE